MTIKQRNAKIRIAALGMIGKRYEVGTVAWRYAYSYWLRRLRSVWLQYHNPRLI